MEEEVERSKVRVVRCPKCGKLLPELPNFTVHRGGGCNATLKAKRRSLASETSSKKFDGETIFGSTMISSEKKTINPRGESVELRGEEKKLPLKELTASDSTLLSRSENVDDLKDSKTSSFPESLIENGTTVRNGKYRRHAISTVNSDILVQDMAQEEQDAIVKIEFKKDIPKVKQKLKWSTRGERTAAIHCSNSHSAEGSSVFNQNPAKRQTLNGSCSAEYLNQAQAEILRKLDELRDQLRGSCEVSEKPKERPSSNGTTFSSNPYARDGHNIWFPERLSSLNGNSFRNTTFINRHSTDISNLYTTVSSQNGIPGYREIVGPHTFGRAPFHPHIQFPRPVSNCLYPDPLVSYHHDGFYHQPASSCLHCYGSHWPSIYSNQRIPYPVKDHVFYQEDGPSMLVQQNYNRRNSSGLPSSNESRRRQRHNFMKKNEHNQQTCRPIAGAAPFVSCYNCFELLQVPDNISVLGKNHHKLCCGACSQLMSFTYDGKRLVTYSPPRKTNVTSGNNNDSNSGINGHMNPYPANSFSGSSDSTGYQVHSADEKHVLPTYSVSSNEMMENEYGFHWSESVKMEGLSSSSSILEDINSPANMICQRDLPISAELPLEALGISHVPNLPLLPSSNQVREGPGNGSKGRCSDQKKILSMTSNCKQNSLRDVLMADDIDSSEDGYPDAGLSQKIWAANKDGDQRRAKNNKSGESFIGGLIKKSFRDLSVVAQSKERGKCKVSINGHPILDRLVKKAEKLAGPIQPGDYWYDYRAGFWGIMWHACLGIIPPSIEEFNFPMPKKCAGGNTGVLVNGRELHRKDLALLVGRGLPPTEGQSYIIEISGKVWDEATGEKLQSLGKLAPTIEKVKRGFGMCVPRVGA